KAPGSTEDVVGIRRETGTDVVVNYLPVGSEEATKWYTEQILNAGCAMRICSVYHLVASSEPTGRWLITTSAPVSLRMPTTSSVGPSAFSTTSDRYLPIPSWVMPRETVTPVFGTSEN